MSGLQIAQLVVEALNGASTIVRGILARTGHLHQAEPYLSLGFVGLSYCERVLASGGDPTQIKNILTQPPSALWADSGDVETEVALIKSSQLDHT